MENPIDQFAPPAQYSSWIRVSNERILNLDHIVAIRSLVYNGLEPGAPSTKYFVLVTTGLEYELTLPELRNLLDCIGPLRSTGGEIQGADERIFKPSKPAL